MDGFYCAALTSDSDYGQFYTHEALIHMSLALMLE